MSLIFEELRKIFKRKSVIFISLLFLLINIGNILYTYDFSVIRDDGYYKIYQKVEGEMTQEKIKYIVDNYKKLSEVIESGNYETEKPDEKFFTGYAFGDMGAFGTHKEEMERIFTYNHKIDKIKEVGKINIEFYKSVNNDYLAGLSEKICNTYGNRTINSYYELSGVDNYLNYNFSSILVMLLIIFTVSIVFSNEHQLNTYAIVKSAKLGGRITAMSKQCAVIIFVFAVCSCFYLSDFLTFLHIGNIFGLSAPIYQIKEFSLTPLTMSVWQFILFSFFIKLIGMVILSFIVLVLSALSRQNITPFVFSCMILFGMMYLSGTEKSDYFNFISLIDCKSLFLSVNFANIFNMPFCKYEVVFFTMLIQLILLSFLIQFVYVKNFIFGSKLCFMKNLKKYFLNKSFL
ncbi:MAG: hypothetical protein U0L17_02085 [Acutalibacteraceae bacterium]|nr:hypothetical protein [Acutalibacteraceae bacterium]